MNFVCSTRLSHVMSYRRSWHVKMYKNCHSSAQKHLKVFLCSIFRFRRVFLKPQLHLKLILPNRIYGAAQSWTHSMTSYNSVGILLRAFSALKAGRMSKLPPTWGDNGKTVHRQTCFKRPLSILNLWPLMWSIWYIMSLIAISLQGSFLYFTADPC